MINLLPPDTRQMYHYARRNYRLLHWIGAASAGLIGALLLTAGGAVFLHNQTESYQAQANTTQQQLKSQNLAGVQKQVTEISNNLKLVVQVLSKEVLFSQLLKRLGTITPPNVILTNLAISQTQGAIDITAQAADTTAATQLQVNLADPANQIFTKADIGSLTCASGDKKTAYPCTINIRALFTDNNPFLFIGDSKSVAGGQKQ
jgi:hypothetical protein